MVAQARGKLIPGPLPGGAPPQRQ